MDVTGILLLISIPCSDIALYR